jgi:hypothetical protein
MNKSRLLAIALMALLGVGFAMTDAMAAGMSKISKAKLVGSWTLVSINNTSPDGKKVQTYGPNDGALILGASGSFVQVLVRSDLPKFASNSRNTGSPDENKAIVQGSLTIFGTYMVNKDGTVTLHVDRSTFPNWNGADQKRTITSLTANEMKWQVPAPSVGGASEAVWKRTK